jgi:hypothetical protein
MHYVGLRCSACGRAGASQCLDEFKLPWRVLGALESLRLFRLRGPACARPLAAHGRVRMTSDAPLGRAVAAPLGGMGGNARERRGARLAQPSGRAPLAHRRAPSTGCRQVVDLMRWGVQVAPRVQALRVAAQYASPPNLPLPDPRQSEPLLPPVHCPARRQHTTPPLATRIKMKVVYLDDLVMAPPMAIEYSEQFSL